MVFFSKNRYGPRVYLEIGGVFLGIGSVFLEVGGVFSRKTGAVPGCTSKLVAFC